MSSTATDTLGVSIEVGDTVTVIGWGHPVRLADVGRRATAAGFTAHGNVQLAEAGTLHGGELISNGDPIARGRAVSPGMLAVARRDGKPGHEGNRPRCANCGDPLDAPTGAGDSAFCADAHSDAPTPTVCEWYALCDHPADGTVAHPILGAVPTCTRCATKHDLKLVTA